MTLQQTPRARAIDARTYCRPKGDLVETREEMLHRSMYRHQKRLSRVSRDELHTLLGLGTRGEAAVAGRTQWLGGTDLAFSRPCSQFNCSYTRVANVYDFVDAAWLLLNGSGVGFKPIVGTLHGYQQPMELEIRRSTRGPEDKGREGNVEEIGETWTIGIGDSAQAWAKALGKMLAPRGIRASKLILDATECRGPGGRLNGYGWICNGSDPLLESMEQIHRILNANAGQLLSEIDILDCVNLVGTVLSSRRSAQIAVLDSHNPRIEEFAFAKRDYSKHAPWRAQSNNTILYWHEPTLEEIEARLYAADRCGGCPAICNAVAALAKCPWFDGLNPCAEILLANKGFCNLVTICLPRFRGRPAVLESAVRLMARANYRQTCVSLEDGVLSPTWHQTNSALRLCGVSFTGVAQAPWLTDYQIKRLRNAAIEGAYSMADELGLPRPKAVTTMKPEGTISKTLGGLDVGEITEGVHKPLGQNIFNWVGFSIHDPLVEAHERAGYKVITHPSNHASKLICFPVRYDGIDFTRVNGVEVNLEPAVAQFDRYMRWNTLWADYNTSCTVSYDLDEIPALAKRIKDNWHRGFIACSFLRRVDPTKTAKDYGHPYLPQEVVSDEAFEKYISKLREVDYSKLTGSFDLNEPACPGGACPVK